MDNVESFLFAGRDAAAAEAEFARSSEQLGDDLVAGLEKVTGRDLAEPEYIRSLMAEVGVIEPDPLEPVEEDPTAFLRQWEDHERAKRTRRRLMRRAARHERWLFGQVAAAHEACHFATPFEVEADESDDGPAIADPAQVSDSGPLRGALTLAGFPVGPMTLADWIAPDIDDKAADRLSLLDTAIRAIGDRRVRKALRREFRRQLAMRSRLAGISSSAAHAPATRPSELAVITAGGKTGDYVPRD